MKTNPFFSGETFGVYIALSYSWYSHSLKILGWVGMQQGSIKEEMAEQCEWSNVVFIAKG